MGLPFLSRAAFYGFTRMAVAPAVHAYFHRLDAVHPERLPQRGPLLIVVNHPASLTDVLILGVVLRRRLRFVAYSGLFRLWIHGAFLRACGALPIYRREDAASLMHRNADTFSDCFEAFDDGEAVVMFPEGTSRDERAVLAFKTGSARMALQYERRAGRSGRLRIVPVGLTFARRGAFRSDVTVAFGVPLAPVAGPGLETGVTELTAEMRAAITALVAHVPQSAMMPTVHAVEDLALEALALNRPGVPRLAIQQAIATALEYQRRCEPSRLARFERRLAAHLARVASVGLDDTTLSEPETPGVLRERARLVTLGALGAIPALLGNVLHAPGYGLSLLAGLIFGRDPARLSFARIMAGLGAFGITYALLGYALVARLGLGVAPALFVVVLCAGLGMFAITYLGWVRRERRRLRLALLAAARPRFVAALRTRRRRLLSLVEGAIRKRGARPAACAAPVLTPPAAPGAAPVLARGSAP